MRDEIRFAHARAKPMIPVFQEAYQIPRATDDLEPSVAAMLLSDGLRLFDRQNVHVEHPIADLAKLVRQTVSCSLST